MTVVNFVGERKPLDAFDVPRMAHRIGVSEDHLRAFLDVEAGSRGFDREGRPVMLFEPHVFYRNLPEGKRAAAVAAGLAYRRWGARPYPRDSYPTLTKALAIDEDAALKACSIGLSQVLVENHSSVGYSTPQAMWQAFMDDEEDHVEAMIRFILANGIADDLKAERWDTVARIYNGPGYAAHGYHTRLAAAYRKWAGVKDTAWAPDRAPSVPVDGEELKAVQRQLRNLGYTEVGVPDGKWGTRTRAAVLAFRADHGLPVYVGVDDEMASELLRARPRDVAPERREATTDDLRRGGSKTIEATDRANGAAVVVGGTGALGVGLQTVGALGEHLDSAQGVVDKIAPLKDALAAAGPWVMVGLAGFVIWQMVKAQRARVDDHRTGKNAGPDKHAQIEVAR